ncbi:unnamed protein product [Amoebophrya sp. A25]|nr:unnamed protein product [Amoebophrya sp. A25]|eukprot:GSA25T00019508001.1
MACSSTGNGNKFLSNDSDHSPNVFVVWLLPSNEAKLYDRLQDCINKLAKENSTPTFVPHITVCGAIHQLEAEEICNRVREVVVAVASESGSGCNGGGSNQNRGPLLDLDFVSVGSQENFWAQDLYLEVKQTEPFLSLTRKVQEKLLSSSTTGERERSLFAPPCTVPHLSLLYPKGGHSELEVLDGAEGEKPEDAPALMKIRTFYTQLRERIKEEFLAKDDGSASSSASSVGEDCLAVVQIGGRTAEGVNISRGWQGIPDWKIVEKIPLKP